MYSSTLSTAQLQLGGSKHLSVPVNRRVSIDFFKFTSMFIGESEALCTFLNLYFFWS